MWSKHLPSLIYEFLNFSVTVMYVTHWLHVPIGALAFQVLTIAMLVIKRTIGKQSGNV